VLLGPWVLRYRIVEKVLLCEGSCGGRRAREHLEVATRVADLRLM
jgi:hypothetical protein